jgi:hypothetical protein
MMTKESLSQRNTLQTKTNGNPKTIKTSRRTGIYPHANGIHQRMYKFAKQIPIEFRREKTASTLLSLHFFTTASTDDGSNSERKSIRTKEIRIDFSYRGLLFEQAKKNIADENGIYQFPLKSDIRIELSSKRSLSIMYSDIEQLFYSNKRPIL